MILITKQTPLESGGRILELESGLCKPRAEIRLIVYRTSAAQESTILAQKPTPKGVLK